MQNGFKNIIYLLWLIVLIVFAANDFYDSSQIIPYDQEIQLSVLFWPQDTVYTFTWFCLLFSFFLSSYPLWKGNRWGMIALLLFFITLSKPLFISSPKYETDLEYYIRKENILNQYLVIYQNKPEDIYLSKKINSDGFEVMEVQNNRILFRVSSFIDKEKGLVWFSDSLDNTKEKSYLLTHLKENWYSYTR